jgi:peptide/nickel transport system permease protein
MKKNKFYVAKHQNTGNKNSQIPTLGRLVLKEIKYDKLAFLSAALLLLIVLAVFIGSPFMASSISRTVNLATMNKAPCDQFLLGTDGSGRDMVAQIFLGARNSFLIAIGVTILCVTIGTLIGLISGFFGKTVDLVIMRVLDFISMLPRLMFIIVIISLIPKYNVITFILIITAFGWIGDARLIRAKTLQQGSLDYVQASKTMGTGNFVIMFREVLPNIGSIVIVNFTLNLAANMGLETGLTFLGFGLPFDTPSLGTLISYASVPENMQMRPWQWLPAALLIVVMMLSINFVGQAIKRAADAKQRIA